MPEHAAVDTSIVNDLTPQALQRTLYTKKSQMYKRQKASLVSVCHSQVYLLRGGWEIHVQWLEWIPFPAKSVQ